MGLILVVIDVVHDPLGDLGAGGVVRAYEENLPFSNFFHDVHPLSWISHECIPVINCREDIYTSEMFQLPLK
jgi:hypothetical protein